MKKVIKVTAEHISRGFKQDSESCPIAMAARDSFLSREVFVGRSIMCVDGYTYDMPPEASRFVRSFDKGLPVEPFEFEVERSV